jgi:hypothetical protein
MNHPLAYTVDWEALDNELDNLHPTWGSIFEDTEGDIWRDIYNPADFNQYRRTEYQLEALANRKYFKRIDSQMFNRLELDSKRSQTLRIDGAEVNILIDVDDCTPIAITLRNEKGYSYWRIKTQSDVALVKSHYGTEEEYNIEDIRPIDPSEVW